MDLITTILFILGFVLLITGAEFLVRGASRLAIAAGISPLVVGLTVVAYGTSAPELAVAVQSTYAGQADIAIGNVVGSNIANILLVMGIAATVSPLVVDQQLVRKEIPLMIGLSFLLFGIGLDGQIGLIDGIVLAAGAVIYTIFVIRQSRKETKAIQDEYTQEFDGNADKYKGPMQIAIQLGLIAIGLVMLITGSGWLIDGAVALAKVFGVSELVIGLTVVAVGTSLPEIATSVVAGMRGEQDIVVGNLVGSNIFNILFVLGFGSVASFGGIAVSQSAVSFDIPVMIVVAIACLPIFFTDYRVARWEGLIFLTYYILYTIYLYLSATGSMALATFTTLLIGFIIPLTVITIATIYIRSYRLNQRKTTA